MQALHKGRCSVEAAALARQCRRYGNKTLRALSAEPSPSFSLASPLSGPSSPPLVASGARGEREAAQGHREAGVPHIVSVRDPLFS